MKLASILCLCYSLVIFKSRKGKCFKSVCKKRICQNKTLLITGGRLPEKDSEEHYQMLISSSSTPWAGCCSQFILEKIKGVWGVVPCRRAHCQAPTMLISMKWDAVSMLEESLSSQDGYPGNPTQEYIWLSIKSEWYFHWLSSITASLVWLVPFSELKFKVGK